jgi:hypothetical protein
LALDPVLNSDVMLERADPLADEAGQLDRVRDRRGRLASVESLRLVLAVFEILRKKFAFLTENNGKICKKMLMTIAARSSRGCQILK